MRTDTPRILFSKRPEDLVINTPGPALCIYHRAYADRIPAIDDCEAIEFRCLGDSFRETDHFAGLRSIVFLGVNRFFSPSSRMHPVFDILQYSLPGVERYSVDTSPYVGALWRLWAHFSFAGVPYGTYTYSFLLESHCTAFADGIRAENPMSDEMIQSHARGNVRLDYDRYFGEPVVEVVSVDRAAHREYARLKEELFTTNTTAVPIIRGLSEFAQSVCPERAVPLERDIYDTPDSLKIVRTDLKVDETLTRFILEKMAEVNHICEVLRS